MPDFFDSLYPWRSIKNDLSILLAKVNQIMTILDDLKGQVARNTTVTQSAVTLLQGLKQKLDDAIASGDPAQLQALSDQLGKDDQALADAITANTPAAPTP